MQMVCTQILTNFIGTLDSTEISLKLTSAFMEDDVSIYDFDGVSSLFSACHRRVIGVSSLFFLTQVRLFVLILNYNCFTHELHMPEVRLFFLIEK
jgi:hypothetical protein